MTDIITVHLFSFLFLSSFPDGSRADSNAIFHFLLYQRIEIYRQRALPPNRRQRSSPMSCQSRPHDAKLSCWFAVLHRPSARCHFELHFLVPSLINIQSRSGGFVRRQTNRVHVTHHPAHTTKTKNKRTSAGDLRASPHGK